MKYRRLGSAGMKVSEISLGGWLTFGESITQKMSENLVAVAFDAGINFIDLADIYARGEAEISMGKILPNYKRSDLVISSKLFWPMSDNVNDRGLSRKHIFESIDKTLKRLGTDYLDIYFCHRFDPETEIEEIVRAMDDLVRQGKIIYWGSSVWESDQIEAAVNIAEKYHCYRPQVEQPRYNLLDRHIESDIMPGCVEHGIGLVVWSPLAQGILTGKYNDGRPSGSRGAEQKWLDDELTPANIERAKKLTTLAKKLNITPGQLALAWVLKHPEVSSAITGATQVDQLQSNLAASDIELSDDSMGEIAKIMG